MLKRADTILKTIWIYTFVNKLPLKTAGATKMQTANLNNILSSDESFKPWPPAD